MILCNNNDLYIYSSGQMGKLAEVTYMPHIFIAFHNIFKHFWYFVLLRDPRWSDSDI